MTNPSDLEYTQVSRREHLINAMALITPDSGTIPTLTVQRAQASHLLLLIIAY